MKELVDISLKVVEYYIKNKKEPNESEIDIKDKSLLKQKGCVFVTFYKNGEVRGSAGNVKEIEGNIVLETIKSVISAISQDNRFPAFGESDLKDLRIRVDYIKSRDILSEGKINLLDPFKSGVLVMSKDYISLGIILPNISSKLLSGEDFIPILEAKMGKPFSDKDSYIYEIKTDVYTNY
ncbi:AMMECR1 domain-containing protein [Candidatus Gracilibacteria bacterium]|nr:AMMECR1 domain-containing protein [Candidatus Gracilibacteria bacterium]